MFATVPFTLAFEVYTMLRAVMTVMQRVSSVLEDEAFVVERTEARFRHLNGVRTWLVDLNVLNFTTVLIFSRLATAQGEPKMYNGTDSQLYFLLVVDQIPEMTCYHDIVTKPSLREAAPCILSQLCVSTLGLLKRRSHACLNAHLLLYR